MFWWNLLYTIALVLTVATECVDKERQLPTREECLNQSALVISASVINVVSDIMILIIPIVAIWGLQMAKKPKFRLTAIFAVGVMQVHHLAINQRTYRKLIPALGASLLVLRG